MKKNLILIIILTFIASCEKDDICIDPTTPHLIIRFYDKNNTSEVKKVTNLKIAVKNSFDEIVDIGAVKTTDSIALPLNVDIDITKVYLTKNVNETSTGIEDVFDVNYSRDEVFVSRSCGYKTVYSNVNATNITNAWLQNISFVSTEINNENQAHLTIFH